MKPIAFTRAEGGEWFSWEEDARPGGTFHAIKFDNGRILDTVNGWRDTRPLTRQQEISLLLFQEGCWLKSASEAKDLRLKAWALSEADRLASRRMKLESVAA